MKLITYKVFNNPKSTFLDKLIGLVTLSNYSHSELLFDDGMCFSISPRENKLRLKKITLGDQWDIQDLDLSTVQVKKARMLCEQLTRLPYTYDYKGAITSPLMLCIQDDLKMFCSEVCVFVLDAVKIRPVFQRGCKYTPSRLRKVIKERSKEVIK